MLRQERDRAVSDLAALLRDTDQIRREQSKSMEELKTLREKIKLKLDTDTRAGVLTSMDSAIDTESCTVSNMTTSSKSSTHNLNFTNRFAVWSKEAISDNGLQLETN